MEKKVQKGDVVYHKADGRRLVVVAINFPEWKAEAGKKYTLKQMAKAKKDFLRKTAPAGFKCSYLNYMRDYSTRDFYPHEISAKPILGFNTLTKQQKKS